MGPIISELPLITNVSKSHLFYKNKVYLRNNFNNKQLSVVKEDIPLYLFCSNRVNFKTLDDSQFSIFLNQIRYVYSNKNTINISDSNSFETQLLVSILDILISSNKNNFIYQNDKDSSIRKEAYSKGYFLKTLKSNFSKWK